MDQALELSASLEALFRMVVAMLSVSNSCATKGPYRKGNVENEG
jgi:hypothetical protein